jgi:hypothetical protein
MSSKNVHGCAQKAENGFGSDFLEQYHEDGNEFLNRIIRVTFVNVETKEQSNQRMHTHSRNKPKKIKQTFSACRKADGRKSVLMVEFMQQGITITSEVYFKTQNTA